MPDPVFNQREQAMLRKLAGFILPIHSPENGNPVYDIVAYLQGLFSALNQDPAAIYAGGPFSGRHPLPGDPPPGDDFKQFLPPSRYQRLAWTLRLDGPEALRAEPFISLSDDLKNNYTGLRDVISAGLTSAINMEDGMAPRPVMAGVLLSAAGSDFEQAFLQLIAEAAFSAPEYGGNLAAWSEISYAGDSLPAGYSGTQISDPDPDPNGFPIQPLANLLFDLTVVVMNGRKFK